MLDLKKHILIKNLQLKDKEGRRHTNDVAHSRPATTVERNVAHRDRNSRSREAVETPKEELSYFEMG